MKLVVANGFIPPPRHPEQACCHSSTERRRRQKSGHPNPVCVIQCMECGRQVGPDIGRKGIALYELKFFDVDIAERNKEQWWQWYDNYLQSPKWDRLRNLTLQRDGYKCQGCLALPATEVHHLNYRNVGDELLIDLISLCDSCHEKADAKRL